MTPPEKARAFASMHVPGRPLVLYNIWDAGSARAVAAAGAQALATGSWSVAEAQGYADGQAMPLDVLDFVVGRIVASVNLPLSVDFEGAWSDDPAQGAANLSRLLQHGIVGINFEDGVVGGAGLHPIAAQVARIKALRAIAGPEFFLNLRTDLFLSEPDVSKHAGLVGPALERAAAYAEAGASGFFVPWLQDAGVIGKLVKDCPLPVNVMWRAGMSLSELSALGVARISHGPGPLRTAQAAITAAAQAAMANYGDSAFNSAR
jgi:2-methylisocitrate lyase-like PEP mutase family enzyme